MDIKEADVAYRQTLPGMEDEKPEVVEAAKEDDAPRRPSVFLRILIAFGHSWLFLAFGFAAYTYNIDSEPDLYIGGSLGPVALVLSLYLFSVACAVYALLRPLICNGGLAHQTTALDSLSKARPLFRSIDAKVATVLREKNPDWLSDLAINSLQLAIFSGVFLYSCTVYDGSRALWWTAATQLAAATAYGVGVASLILRAILVCRSWEAKGTSPSFKAGQAEHASSKGGMDKMEKESV